MHPIAFLRVKDGMWLMNLSISDRCGMISTSLFETCDPFDPSMVKGA